MKSLLIVEFGNPILRKTAKLLNQNQIKSPKIQKLIKGMYSLLITEKAGVAVAAPQVGESLALVVIAIRPTTHRPNVTSFDLVLINPTIEHVYGKKSQMWEGCLSAGKSGLFARVPRYKKIKAKYYDQAGELHEHQFSGLKAQIIQHEVDHLNGKLFMDRVIDSSTYMTLKQYRQRITTKYK